MLGCLVGIDLSLVVVDGKQGPVSGRLMGISQQVLTHFFSE